MEGGEIFGNSGDNAGGVCVMSGATFTMKGGTIYGNAAEQPNGQGNGGGVNIWQAHFIMEGGRIQGSADSDGFAANTDKQGNAALTVNMGDDSTATAKWGTGGTYTKGGVTQTGDSDIGNSNDTLIAIPGNVYAIGDTGPAGGIVLHATSPGCYLLF